MGEHGVTTTETGVLAPDHGSSGGGASLDDVAWIYVSPAILLLGVVGNSLVLAVMRRMHVAFHSFSRDTTDATTPRYLWDASPSNFVDHGDPVRFVPSNF